MGREWYKGGRSRSICSSKRKSKSSEANGCITALYPFFQFCYFQFPSRHHHYQPSIDSPSRNPKGLIAPRNSLELKEEIPLSTNYKDIESLNIHVGRTKSKLKAILNYTSSDICNSPHVKTPNVVARLMGLDFLPDNLDLNTVRGQRLSENREGTRSLPESPRVSSAQKSDSDTCRLSLQLNRENKYEESGSLRLKELKQIKEKVNTRGLGLDITNLLENRMAGEAENKIELKKVSSRSSQKENIISFNPTLMFKEDKISQQPTKLTLLQDSKKNLKRVNEQKLRPINGSSFSLYSTPKNQNRQGSVFNSTPTNSKSDQCHPLVKKICNKIPQSNEIVNISVASSAVSVRECPRKEMIRAEEHERNVDATICSGQIYKYEEKLPQEQRGSSTTISATFANAGGTKIDFKHLPEMKKLVEEEEKVVAEIERHIVDALVLETVKILHR